MGRWQKQDCFCGMNISVSLFGLCMVKACYLQLDKSSWPKKKQRRYPNLVASAMSFYGWRQNPQVAPSTSCLTALRLCLNPASKRCSAQNSPFPEGMSGNSLNRCSLSVRERPGVWAVWATALISRDWWDLVKLPNANEIISWVVWGLVWWAGTRQIYDN